MSLGKVSREIIDHIMLIGLDRVAKRNAFDSHMIEDLSLALTEYENNPELRCAVIFAHGDHFTAGLDLVELQPKIPQGFLILKKLKLILGVLEDGKELNLSLLQCKGFVIPLEWS
jgi:enoyl-CoA hydratase/carnithine racemase